MNEKVLRLYPPPNEEKPLQGLNLEHELRHPTNPSQTFVCADSIVSLDGRVSLIDTKSARLDTKSARRRVP